VKLFFNGVERVRKQASPKKRQCFFLITSTFVAFTAFGDKCHCGSLNSWGIPWDRADFHRTQLSKQLHHGRPRPLARKKHRLYLNQTLLIIHYYWQMRGQLIRGRFACWHQRRPFVPGSSKRLEKNTVSTTGKAGGAIRKVQDGLFTPSPRSL